jgi:hypothetical protein
VKAALYAAVVVVASISSPLAWADECGNAVGDYNTVLAQLNDATQEFSACVADSLGMHDCATQFKKLQLLYGQFQAAVDVYLKQCL